MPDPSVELKEPLLKGVVLRLTPSRKVFAILALCITLGVAMLLWSLPSTRDGHGDHLTEEELPMSEVEVPIVFTSTEEDPSMRRRRSVGGRRGQPITEEDFEKQLNVKGTYSWNEKEVKPWMVEGGGSKIAGKPREPGMGGGFGEDEGEPGTGTVQMWNGDKGYGFITPEGAGPKDENLFCHVNNVIGTIAKGDKVKYRSRFNQRKGKKECLKVKKFVEGEESEEEEKKEEEGDEKKKEEESEIEGDDKLR